MITGEMYGGALRDQVMTDLTGRVEDLRSEGKLVCIDLLNPNPDSAPSATYVNLKVRGAQAVGIVPNLLTAHSADFLPAAIETANNSPYSDGIVVQLPFREDEAEQTDAILGLIEPNKDVDGLRDGDSLFTPATPRAIVRLLEHHHVDLGSEPVAVLGLGRLVGKPLLKHLTDSGADVIGVDLATPDLERVEAVNHAKVIVSAMGTPGILTPALFNKMSERRVLVDAGVAGQSGNLQGDASAELRDQALQNGWLINAVKGSVGPLTVATLLENVVISAERRLEEAAA